MLLGLIFLIGHFGYIVLVTFKPSVLIQCQNHPFRRTAEIQFNP